MTAEAVAQEVDLVEPHFRHEPFDVLGQTFGARLAHGQFINGQHRDDDPEATGEMAEDVLEITQSAKQTVEHNQGLALAGLDILVRAAFNDGRLIHGFQLRGKVRTNRAH